jgi:hypothetical protein
MNKLMYAPINNPINNPNKIIDAISNNRIYEKPSNKTWINERGGYIYVTTYISNENKYLVHKYPYNQIKNNII